MSVCSVYHGLKAQALAGHACALARCRSCARGVVSIREREKRASAQKSAALVRVSGIVWRPQQCSIRCRSRLRSGETVALVAQSAAGPDALEFAVDALAVFLSNGIAEGRAL